ncbi:MAG: transposase family protein [Gammaproteobacteria bacterium]
MLLIESHSEVVLSSALVPGSCHDRALSTQQPLRLNERTHCGADMGYQGLQQLHALTWLPFKATQYRPLDEEQRAYNRALARVRIKVEHVIRSLKIFSILAERYRNRCRRFALRVNLIAGLYNRFLLYS